LARNFYDSLARDRRRGSQVICSSPLEVQALGGYARDVKIKQGKAELGSLSRCSPWRLPNCLKSWSYELKLDSYRGVGMKAAGKVRYTRETNTILFALANLYQVRRQLLPARAKCTL
jgi:hypothetical protein